MGHTSLHAEDWVQAVGSEDALSQLGVLLGERKEGELPLVESQDIQSLLLTNKNMINKQLGDLNFASELRLYRDAGEAERYRSCPFT